MKPWLFDILACPIDKYFPLDLYIFSYETKSNYFQTLIEGYKNREKKFIEEEKIIQIAEENDNIFINDNVVLEKTQLSTYIDLIISSINELDNLFDRTQNDLSKKCFNLIQSAVKPKILEFAKDYKSTQINEIIPELIFLNKIKTEIEIESGLLFCRECNRWYPIVDTIPQMLPDEYRNKEKEIMFLQNHRNLLNEEFLNQDLKPFNI